VDSSDAESTSVVDESMLEELALPSTPGHLPTIEDKSGPEKRLVNKNKETALSHITQIENSEKALKDVHLTSTSLRGQALAAKKPLRPLIWRRNAHGTPDVQRIDAADLADIALLQSRGAINLPACSDCANNQGPFTLCVSSPLSLSLWHLCCANCLWAGNELFCSRGKIALQLHFIKQLTDPKPQRLSQAR